jgi:hypothetical protein
MDRRAQTRRLALSFAVAVAAALLGPLAAVAGATGNAQAYGGGTLLVMGATDAGAAGNDDINVSYSSIATTYTITDTLGVVPGNAACIQGIDANTVTCPDPSGTTSGVQVDGNAGDDQITVGSIGPNANTIGMGGQGGVDHLTNNSPVAASITSGLGNDFVTGGPGADRIFELSISDGNDTIDGGGGGDTLWFASLSSAARTNPVTVHLPEPGGATTTGNGESGESDTLANIRNVHGGNGDDLITGSTESNMIDGGAGADTIDDTTGSGNTLVGGAGDDTINSYNHVTDLVQCGTEDDTLQADSADTRFECEHVSLDGGATPPSVSLIDPHDGSFTNDTTPTVGGLAGTASGDSSTVSVRLYTGQTPTGTPFSVPTAQQSSGQWSLTSPTLAEGTYTARAEQDNTPAGTGFSDPHTFTVDTTAPTVTITGPSGAGTDATPDITGTAGNASGLGKATDDDAVRVRIWRGAAPAGDPFQSATAPNLGGNWSLTAGTLPVGDYTAVADQGDGADNVGTSAPQQFEIKAPANPPPPPPAGTQINTLSTTRMPAVVGLEVAKGRKRVLRALAYANFVETPHYASESALGKHPGGGKWAVGDIVDQDPAACPVGGSNPSSCAIETGAGPNSHPDVHLEYWAGTSKSDKRHCYNQRKGLPVALKGADLDTALDLLKQGGCHNFDIHYKAGKVPDPVVTSAKPDGKDPKQLDVNVTVPKNAAQQDLFIFATAKPNLDRLVYPDAKNWELTQDLENGVYVQVVDRAGRAVVGASVDADCHGTGVASDHCDQFGTEGDGYGLLHLTPQRAGRISLTVSASDSNGNRIFGFGELNVADRSGEDSFDTILGQHWMRIGGKGPFVHCTVKNRPRGCPKPRSAATRVHAAGSCSLCDKLLGLWAQLFPPPKPGATRAETLAAGVGAGVTANQLLLNKPANGSAPVIAAGSGNVIAAGSGNVITIQPGYVIAAGSGNVIAAGAGNVIAAGAGNVIAAGSNNLTSGQGQLVDLHDGTGVIAAGSGNVIAAGAGNVIAAGAHN